MNEEKLSAAPAVWLLMTTWWIWVLNGGPLTTNKGIKGPV